MTNPTPAGPKKAKKRKAPENKGAPAKDDAADADAPPAPAATFIDFNALSPADIAHKLENVGENKSNMTTITLMVLSMMGGAFIACGGLFATVVMTDSLLGYGPTKLLGGISFSLGLILVVIGGAELFTGNNWMVLGWAEGKFTTAKVLRNWTLCFIFNVIGSFFIVFMVQASGVLVVGSMEKVGRTAIAIAEVKTTLGTYELFIRAVFCNMLVCLAIWISLAARNVAGKIFALIFPVSGFIAMGMEHSIANAYLIPIGLLTKAELAGTTISLSDTFPLLIHNIVPVTLGNIFGGAVLVAGAFYLVYFREKKIQALLDEQAKLKAYEESELKTMAKKDGTPINNTAHNVDVDEDEFDPAWIDEEWIDEDEDEDPAPNQPNSNNGSGGNMSGGGAPHPAPAYPAPQPPQPANGFPAYPMPPAYAASAYAGQAQPQSVQMPAAQTQAVQMPAMQQHAPAPSPYPNPAYAPPVQAAPVQYHPPQANHNYGAAPPYYPARATMAHAQAYAPYASAPSFSAPQPNPQAQPSPHAQSGDAHKPYQHYYNNAPTQNYTNFNPASSPISHYGVSHHGESRGVGPAPGVAPSNFRPVGMTRRSAALGDFPNESGAKNQHGISADDSKQTAPQTSPYATSQDLLNIARKAARDQGHAATDGTAGVKLFTLGTHKNQSIPRTAKKTP
ncbi:MAG: formate/nitrite transporter family protein [Alphaproteobacteria bacterium]